MKRKNGKKIAALPILLTGFIVIGLVLFLLLRPSPKSNDPPISMASKAAVSDYLESLSSKLAENEVSSKTLLDDIRSQIRNAPPEEAIAAIISYLQSGKDASTGSDLSISDKGDGSLASAPSLRVALLDLLGQIAPEMSGPVSEEILAKPTTPDEWAIALRNVARAYPDDRSSEIIKEKALALLQNRQWRENPTYGYFEALDCFVHTGYTEAIPEIVTLFDDPDRTDLGYAGFLTLDRLTLVKPKEAMSELLKARDLQSTHGPMVANLFARADIRDAAQVELLADYLTTKNRPNNELTAWAETFPNGNYIHSLNLLTKTNPRSGPDQADHDAKALQLISTWLTEPRFQEIRPTLQTAQNRLRYFVQQANKPPRKG